MRILGLNAQNLSDSVRWEGKVDQKREAIKLPPLDIYLTELNARMYN